MSYIVCQFCGDSYPDFDVAHMCRKGPNGPKLDMAEYQKEQIRNLLRQELELRVETKAKYYDENYTIIKLVLNGEVLSEITLP